MAILGNNEIESGNDYNYPNVKASNMHALTESGSLTKVSFYIANTQTGHATTKGRAFVYSENPANIPDALVGISTTEVTITDNQSAGWVDFPFSTPVSLSPDNYFIGVHFDAGGAGIVCYLQTTGGICGADTDTYSDGTRDPYGSFGTGRVWLYSLYATYTPAGFTGLTVTRLLQG